MKINYFIALIYLCEQVHSRECDRGYWGDDCRSLCGTHCKKCFKKTGKCRVCQKNYYANSHGKCEHCDKKGCVCSSLNDCAACQEGYYLYLDETKNANCVSCMKGCKSCEDSSNCTTCDRKRYGPTCQLPCPDNCENDSCDVLLGTCACLPNFTGSRCELCISGKYTTSCSKNCSLGCVNGCNIHKGSCSPCVDGYHGQNCSERCSDGCNNNVCDQNSAECKQACKSGFFGKHCCRPGMFGKSCEHHCSPKCATCTSLNECTTCKSGRYGLECDHQCPSNCEACTDGRTCLTCSSTIFYGKECNIPCNNNCINQSCYINGTCINGCVLNLFGKSCDTPCSTNCAHNGSESRCSFETGLCLFGCSKGYKGESCMEAIRQETNLGSIPTYAIGGGVAAVVVFAIVIIVGIFILIRRRNRKPKTEAVHEHYRNADNASAPVYATVVRSGNKDMVHAHTSSVDVEIAIGHDPVYTNDEQQLPMKIVTTEESLRIDELDNIASQNAIRFEENGGVYYNNDTKVKKFKIPVAELQTFVRSKNMDFFKTEFEKLPYGLLKDYQVSQTTANITKNRYKGIYPYDDYRVKVVGGDTDYINASFIDGYKKRHEYIAALGPMSSQLGDFSAFWRMVWQQKVEKIVMITNLVEKRTVKCEQYWPNASVSQVYGDIRVVCLRENHYAEFTRRTFTVMKANEERILHHLHFTAWPDKDVPEDVTSIIEFREKILHAPVVLGGPTIVHCSAGVGRTGTYIAIDIVTKEGESEGAVDIAGCVLNTRQNRPNMVQTVEQFEYIHHAVVHSLTFDCKHVSGEKFQAYMNNIAKEQIKNIFHKLQETKTQVRLEETEAVERNTNFTDKNRKGSDIPGDVNRPRLYLNQKPGASDYINAVYANSFQGKNKYILAQSPLQHTVADFLALVVQTDCACIVNFESTSATRNNVGVYVPPDNKVLKKGIFNVRCSKPDANAFRIKRKLTIDYHGKELFLTNLEFTNWNKDQNLPDMPSDFRQLIAEVEIVTANTNADRPVLLHCLDGASKCALFSVVASLLQAMEVEHEVSIVNAVRKVRSRRKGAIPNSEQFQFCHDCVLDYIKSSNTYSKFVADL